MILPTLFDLLLKTWMKPLYEAKWGKHTVICSLWEAPPQTLFSREPSAHSRCFEFLQLSLVSSFFISAYNLIGMCSKVSKHVTNDFSVKLGKDYVLWKCLPSKIHHFHWRHTRTSWQTSRTDLSLLQMFFHFIIPSWQTKLVC